MKESNYNFFYETINEKTNLKEVISYNSKTNALGIMDYSDYLEYKNSKSNGFNGLKPKLKEDLKLGGFIVEDNVNELQILKLNNLKTQFDTRNLDITITPTLECNFKCTYCFETTQNQNYMMSEETQDHIIEFIENQANSLENIFLTWFGGEPLLAFDIVERMTKKIKDICAKNNVNYSATIVTNGYCLTEEIAAKFKELNITTTQITLDGPADVHDKRRILKGNKPSFDVILNNMCNALKYLDSISLRINVDKFNLDRYHELLKVLEERDILSKVFIHLGQVTATNGCYNDCHCLNFKEFVEVSFDFANILKEFTNKPQFVYKYPELHNNACGADLYNSVVIDPHGRLFKCWNDIGIDKFCIGDIVNGITSYDRYNDFMLYDITADPKCKDCKYLPICMGGCPRKRLDNTKERCVGLSYLGVDFFKTFIKEHTESQNIEQQDQIRC